MHYYSYKLHEVEILDAPTYDYLCECMIKAKANDDLEALEIISYPHLKDTKARNSAMNEIRKRAETQQQLDKRVVTSDDLSFFGVKVGNIADHIKE
jgi:hypothetical protein